MTPAVVKVKKGAASAGREEAADAKKKDHTSSTVAATPRAREGMPARGRMRRQQRRVVERFEGPNVARGLKRHAPSLSEPVQERRRHAARAGCMHEARTAGRRTALGSHVLAQFAAATHLDDEHTGVIWSRSERRVSRLAEWA